MTILGHNLGHNSPQAQVSRGILGERVSEMQNMVDGVLGKMREQEIILLEKKRRIEEIAVICEEQGKYTHIYPFAKILRETGDVNMKDAHGYTILTRASDFLRTIEIIKPLLAHPDILVNEKSDDGMSPLALAILRGKTSTVKLLLTHPDILVNEKYNTTPLMMAEGGGNVDITKAILADFRLDLREHDQGKRTLMQTKNEEIRALIEAKMREQGIKF